MMIIKGSMFNVVDNTGARMVQCIQTLRGKKATSLLRVGDTIVVVVKRMENITGGVKLKVKKSHVCYGLIVKSKQNVRRKSGMILKADMNGVILLNNKYEPLGTRLLGSIFKESEGKIGIKLMSIAKFVI